MRTLPNILIAGTPGTGKSTLCEQLAESTGLEWLDIGGIAKENKLYEGGYDSTYGCEVLNEERLLDEIEDQMNEGGKIVDFFGTDFFPQRWFDIVFILRTDNTVLYDRLTTRGYTGKKLQDNVQCEIFQVILDEAKDSYSPDIVFELPSTTPDEMESNIEKITAWVEQYKLNNSANNNNNKTNNPVNNSNNVEMQIS